MKSFCDAPFFSFPYLVHTSQFLSSTLIILLVTLTLADTLPPSQKNQISIFLKNDPSQNFEFRGSNSILTRSIFNLTRAPPWSTSHRIHHNNSHEGEKRAVRFLSSKFKTIKRGMNLNWTPALSSAISESPPTFRTNLNKTISDPDPSNKFSKELVERLGSESELGWESDGSGRSRSQSNGQIQMRVRRRAKGQTQAKKKVLTILGLFELTPNGVRRESGYSEMSAAELALAHVNEQNIVKGYKLEMYSNDTKCDSGVGMDAFYHAIYSKNMSIRMISLLGTACSEVTERLAKIVPYWNMVQVAFGSTSPSLSDRAEFPLFYRTVAPIRTHDEAIIELIRHFHWDTVTFFTKNENRYTMPANHLVRELENANISCKATLTFSPTDFKEQLKVMKEELDSRIIIASFGSDIAPCVFCDVYHNGMYGSDYAWIWIGQPDVMWWGEEAFKASVTSPDNTKYCVEAKKRSKSGEAPLNDTITHNCSYKQLTAAVQNTLIFDRHNLIEDNIRTSSGLLESDFRKKLNGKLREKNISKESPFAPETYDAVWSIALGLQGVREKFNYTLETVHYNDSIFSARLMEIIKDISFIGISGPVSFSGPDRVGITSIMQIQGGVATPVGLFSPRRDSILNLNCSGCVQIRWQKNQVPIARREFRIKIIRVENSPYIIVAAVASLGIVMAAAFLAFNLYHRKLKYIKLSSPRLNNMVIIGCIFAYVAVILLGSDFGPEADGKHFAYICTVRAYLLSTGFSLAFGAMFAKTYRVHRIFTRSCLGVVKNKLLRDTQLMTLVMALLLIDCLIVSTWAIFDPMHRNLQNLTIEDDPMDRSVVYQPQIEVCRSQHGHVWLSILYGYKSLLLVVGVYMAWETRHVKIQALNDSNYIGLCVYVVVLTSVLGVSLANLVSEKVTLSFVSVTSLILISTTVTLCLLFLPKIHAIVSTPTDVDPVVESMGLKIEFNTRRFMTEDTKESLFRAEVQNRVYKRQIESIDAEIRRLEQLFAGIDSNSKLQTIQDLQTLEPFHSSKNVPPVVQVTADPSSSMSSEDTESQSEIYTIYLHGPRFIIPISLFNFSTNSPTSPLSTVATAASEARAVATAVGISSSSNPRSSWPNTRATLSPSNGLIATKFCFKSEPRLLSDQQDQYSFSNNSIQTSQKQQQQSHSAENFGPDHRRQQQQQQSPETQFSSSRESLVSPKFLSIETNKSNHVHRKKYDSNSTRRERERDEETFGLGTKNFKSRDSVRKDSSTSCGSKQTPASFLLSVLKNPVSYLTGIINYKSSNFTTAPTTTYKPEPKGIYDENHYCDDVGGMSRDEGRGGVCEDLKLQPRHYLQGSKVSHQLSSSVPEIWAVRNSPTLEARKKHCNKSDTVVDTSRLLPFDCHTSISIDPVLKLIATSDESPYL